MSCVKADIQYIEYKKGDNAKRFLELDKLNVVLDFEEMT